MPLSKRKASAPRKLKPLWQCPDCGNRFVTRNSWHSCGTNTLKALFSHSDAEVFKLFKKFSKMVQACGPGKMLPQQTRVVFQVRTRFAGCYPRKSHMDCAVALPRRIESPGSTGSIPTASILSLTIFELSQRISLIKRFRTGSASPIALELRKTSEIREFNGL